MIETFKRWHRWLTAHQAYFWGLLAIFPELWVASPDLQSMLPAVVVSRVASVIAVIGFSIRLRASIKAAKALDDTDKAGA